MSAQINFYIIKSDWEKVIQYIDTQNFILIENTSLTTKPTVLANWHIGNVQFIQKYLVLASQLDKVQMQLSPARNLYYIDVINLPVIEVQTGFFTENQVYRGRFYYDEGYFEQDSWVQKNQEFLEKAQAFFDWFKKDLKFHDVLPNYYVSESAQNLELVI